MLEEVYNLEDALLVSCYVNTLLWQSERVHVGCLAQIINVIARRDEVPFLDVAAAIGSGNGRAALFMLNRDLDSERGVTVVWPDLEPTRVLACRTITRPDLKAFNTFERPDHVVPQTLDAPRAGVTMTFELPARSYSVAHFATG